MTNENTYSSAEHFSQFDKFGAKTSLYMDGVVVLAVEDWISAAMRIVRGLSVKVNFIIMKMPTFVEYYVPTSLVSILARRRTTTADPLNLVMKLAP